MFQHTVTQYMHFSSGRLQNIFLIIHLTGHHLTMCLSYVPYDVMRYTDYEFMLLMRCQSMSYYVKCHCLVLEKWLQQTYYAFPCETGPSK